MRFLRAFGYALGLPAILVAIWWFASAGSQDVYFPPLRTIVESFPGIWLEGGADARIVSQGVPSLLRLFSGYLLALVVGVALGTAIGAFDRARAFAEPTLELLRAIPGPVLVPVLSLFAGIGDQMKVLVVFAGCVWPVLLNTVEGVRAIDPVLSDSAKAYRVTGLSRWRHLVVPSAGPQIVAGMRQALAVGIILMVISEMFAATDGLGFTVVRFQRNFAIAEMWTGIIVLGVLGFALSLLFRLFETRTLRWYYGQREASTGSGK